MKTLLKSDPGITCCYVCETILDLHEHHVFGGPNRAISEKYKCKVKLCGKHHNLSPAGVHLNKELDLKLKIKFQKLFMEKHGAEEFRRKIGRNYLDETIW